jgi:hypothetical protein
VTDEPEPPGIDSVRRRLLRPRARDAQSRIDETACGIVKRLVDHFDGRDELREFVTVGPDDDAILVEVANPLEIILDEYFGYFGYYAGCEALKRELDALGPGQGRKLPKAIRDAGEALKPFMPRPGKPGGRTSFIPDRLGARNRLWLYVSDYLAAKGLGPEGIARHIHEHENYGNVTLEYLRKHLRKLRQRRDEQETGENDW